MSQFKCPTWLDAEAKKEWKRVIKELEKDDTDLQLLDSKSLEGYCQTYNK